ncbi:MAG: PH domain-containing protein [Actinomycetota bacterium]|nr:PH domain-containing protein [Actinomycetota bacterium]
MGHSDSRREAIEVAARPLRELQKAEYDQIAAAQRALREAEKAHTAAADRAQRELRTATSPTAIAAYGHRVILFEDRLSTPGGNHALTAALNVRVEDPPEGAGGEERGLALVIEEPGWTETVLFPREDEAEVRALAAKIESAAATVDAVAGERRDEAEGAQRRLTAASTDRRSIEEARALVHRLGELCEEDEDVLDMAPAISAGHDGVLVATDRRLLFVSLRRTLSFPYGEISSVAVKGKWFGSRLAVTAADGKGVFSGVARQHACEIAALVRERIGDPVAVT